MRVISLICIFTLLFGTIAVPVVRADDVEVVEELSDDEFEGEEEEVVGGSGRAVSIDDEEEEDYDDEDGEGAIQLEPHEDITTSYVFSDNAERRFPYGEPVEILLGVANDGQYEFNVTHVSASLVSPQDYSYHIENYTWIAVDSVVNPGEQVSVLYYFKPHEALEARTYALTVQVWYEDVDGAPWRSPAYNGTFEIVEPSDFVDATTFFAYTAGVAAVVLVGVIASRVSGGKKGGRSFESGTSSKNISAREAEWISGAPGVKKSGARSSPRKRSSKK